MKIDKDVIRILINIILFALGIIFNNKILLIISYILASIKVYIELFKEKELFNENFLMVVASLGAIYLNEYHEAVLIMILFSLGEYLSDYAIYRSKSKISEVLDIRSEVINLKNTGYTDVKNAKVGDVFIVASGENIALDGVVVKGETNLDTSSLTGEVCYKEVSVGSTVLSGEINMGRVIEVKALKKYEDTTASNIVKLLKEYENNKTKTEKFITKFAKIYTPIVLLIAVIVALIDINNNLYKALEILVISCPCALIISIPLSYFLGIGYLSKKGILIKQNDCFDKLSEIDTCLFDKTGTLTDGVFDIININAVGCSEEELLEIVVNVEEGSNHLIAKSLKNKMIKKLKCQDLEEISGKGIKCMINNEEVLVGNEDLLNDKNIKVIDNKTLGSIIHVAKNNKYLGNIVLGDRIKDNLKKVIDDIKLLGLDVLIISGDKIENVEKVAKELGISKYYGHLLPQEKLDIIKQFNNALYVGDGINDALALKVAKIGVSFGNKESDIANLSSDVILMSSSLEKIVILFKTNKYLKKIIIENIVLALLIKILVIILAYFGVVPMYLAVLSDTGLSILTILNSLRIFMHK